MLILLPPSESKSERVRGRPMRPRDRSFPALDARRAEVAEALVAVSGAEDATARLKVSPGLAAEVARNTRLAELPVVGVAELYDGVLYDALDLTGLDAAARRRAARWVVVCSALHGALRLGDRVPPYRLSMGVSLPGLGPLAAAWRPALSPVLAEAAGEGLVVDCRSAAYAAAWTPTDGHAERWLQVVVPGASHSAKHTRGLVAREICRRGSRARTPAALAGELAETFDVELERAPRAGWALRVRPGVPAQRPASEPPIPPTLK